MEQLHLQPPIRNNYYLYDMAGNVIEFTNNIGREFTALGQVNPTGPEWFDTCDYLREHIETGGSYNMVSIYMTAWYRVRGGEGWGGVDRVFRCVLQSERLISIKKMQ